MEPSHTVLFQLKNFNSMYYYTAAKLSRKDAQSFSAPSLHLTLSCILQERFVSGHCKSIHVILVYEKHMVHTEWVSLYIYHKLYWLSFSCLVCFFLCYSIVSDQTLFSLVVISFLNFIVKPSLQLYTILHCIVIDPA